jgi:transcriptional regulator with XRE-family HTH domain
VAEDFIGARVRYWRLKRGMSQKMLADFVGLTQSYISYIEAGLKAVDKRSTLIRLAQTLQVSVADLTDVPGPEFPEHSAADAAVPAIRAALNMVRLGASVEPSRTIGELARAVDELSLLRMRAQLDRVGQLSPDILLDLHGLSSGDDRSRQEALRLMVCVAYCMTATLKDLRYPDLATIAAEQGYQAAAKLADPAWRGVAEFARLNSLPAENKILMRQLAVDAADRLQPSITSTEAMQTYGMLHLTAGLTSAVCEKPDDVQAHLTEAAETAARTGEGNFALLFFGPTNVGFWRTMVAVEMGEGGRVSELARDIHPELVESKTRQAAYYTDVGRGLAQTRRHDREALVNFIRAESIAPQQVRLNPAVRDTVGAMLRRARAGAGGAQLRDLASRVGVA